MWVFTKKSGTPKIDPLNNKDSQNPHVISEPVVELLWPDGFRV